MTFALVVSSYHAYVTKRLESGARAALRDAGVADGDVSTFVVPGAFELAQAARHLAETGAWSGIVCLGCLIKGETPHFDYIARAAADGIMRAAQETGVPVSFGVLTTNTMEEALARAGEVDSNKGSEAAKAAFGMATLYRQITEGGAAKR